MNSNFPLLSNVPAATLRAEENYWRGVCDERGRMAAELHDQLFARLNEACLRLQGWADTLAGESAPAGLGVELEEILRSLQDTATEVRGWLADQPPPSAARETLEEALHRAAGEIFSADAGWRVRLTLAHLPPLPVRLRWELARIGQEALRNAARHAGPCAVEICLEILPADGCHLRLCVRDDGLGFDVSAPAPDSRRFGLRAMRTRAKRCGGHLTVESTRGHGTAVTLVVPTGPPGLRSAALAEESPLLNPALDA